MTFEKLNEILKSADAIDANIRRSGLELISVYSLAKEAYLLGQEEALKPQPIETAPKDGYYTGFYFIEGTTEAPTVMHSARYYKGQNKHLFTGDNFKVEPNYWMPTISLRKGN